MEHKVLASLPLQERYRQFIRIWTLKEAYLKAIGVGLGDPNRPPHDFDFSSMSYRTDEVYSIGKQNLEGWLFYSKVVNSNYHLSIALGRFQDADSSLKNMGGNWKSSTLLTGSSDLQFPGRICIGNTIIHISIQSISNCVFFIVCFPTHFFLFFSYY